MLKTFGKYLRELRKSKRMSVAELAKRTGFAGSTISRYELDQRVPRMNFIESAATVLDVEIEELLKFAENEIDEDEKEENEIDETTQLLDFILSHKTINMTLSNKDYVILFRDLVKFRNERMI